MAGGDWVKFENVDNSQKKKTLKTKKDGKYWKEKKQQSDKKQNSKIK